MSSKDINDDVSADCVNDDWCIGPSDDENGADEIDPKVIIEMYKKICNEGYLEISWKNPGRRPPEDEKKETNNMEATNEANFNQDAKEKNDEVPTEFDFDAFSSEPSQVTTPRRTPGATKTPRHQKRVATMDKILGDIYRKKKDKIPPGTFPGFNTPQRMQSASIFQSPVVPFMGTNATTKPPD